MCINFEEKKEELDKLKKKTENVNFWQDVKNANNINKKISNLEKVIVIWSNLKKDSEDLQDLINSISEEEICLIEEELKSLISKYEENEINLFFSEEHDSCNALVEINSGAGGTEAQDWAEMLSRMYFRYAEKKDFSVEIIEKTNGIETGIKSMSFEIKGENAYALLKGEKGTHRLVRQSPFNAKNLRQTSFAGVITTPIIENNNSDVKIDEKDIRIDTFRASGAGGQHVNKTDSAIRIVHLPTSITVECQNQRSQHQNKEKALEILKSKLILLKEEEDRKKANDIRGIVDEAAWGTQIRNYVLHPYKMIKDLRTNFESSNPDDVLNGNLDDFIKEFLKWYTKNINEL